MWTRRTVLASALLTASLGAAQSSSAAPSRAVACTLNGTPPAAGVTGVL